MPKGSRKKAGKEASSEKDRHGIPRWQQIEIMLERAQLREALGGLEPDLDGYEKEVFGSEEEYEALHEHSDNPEDENVDFGDLDLEQDDIDDFEVD